MEKGYTKADVLKIVKSLNKKNATCEVFDKPDGCACVKVTILKNNVKHCYSFGTSVSGKTKDNYYYLNVFGSSFNSFPWNCHGGNHFGGGSFMYSYEEIKEIIKNW